jgi:lactoylglutathione lyase
LALKLGGVEPGPGPRHALFIYVDDIESALETARRNRGRVLRDPIETPWGECLAYLTDPEGNVVAIAASADR